MLSVEEAKVQKVCRVCRRPLDPAAGVRVGSVTLNFTDADDQVIGSLTFPVNDHKRHVLGLLYVDQKKALLRMFDEQIDANFARYIADGDRHPSGDTADDPNAGYDPLAAG
jgi:hypothetical protein